MSKDSKTIDLELIQRAQQGDAECVSDLSELTRVKVFAYLYRMTLNHDLAEDLCQETQLQMIKSLPGLRVREAGQFWSWLYKTALSKVQRHFRKHGNQKIMRETVVDSDQLTDRAISAPCAPEELMRNELTQAVIRAIGLLTLRHRSVLALRCYEQLSYEEIGRTLDASPRHARLLFFRAKQSLKRQLVNDGFEKKHLLSALGLFGAVTAGSGKTASAAAVGQHLTQVGIGTACLGTITSKLGIMTLVTAGAIGLCITSVVMSHHDLPAPPAAAPMTKVKATDMNAKTKFKALLDDQDFAPPISVLKTSNADPGFWKSFDRSAANLPLRAATPEQWLVGEQPNSSYGLVIPENQWVEVLFSGPIIDNPGIDLFIMGWDQANKPRVLLTDGIGQQVELRSPQYIGNTLSLQITAFDLSQQDLTFPPTAIRIVGTNSNGPAQGFELCAVRARLAQQ